MNTNTVNAFDDLINQRRESGKWKFWLCIFILPCLITTFINKAPNEIDYLGGKTVVESFLNRNIISFLIIFITFIAFIIFVFKTWKGFKSSIFQLMMVFGASVMILFCGYAHMKAVFNINGELKAPADITAESYVLCEGNGNYYAAFEDTGESVLLVIPKEKYDMLKNGKMSEASEQMQNQTYRLIKNSQYGGYENPKLYKSKANFKYYDKSVIYIDCSLR